jgi:ABC-type bacteriocin/lantibiotic exporter with double-glycine peptidase domain
MARTPSSDHVFRGKEIDRMFEFFSGPACLSFLEYGGALCSLVVLVMVSPPLAIVPTVAVGLLALLVLRLLPFARGLRAKARVISLKAQSFRVEAVLKADQVRAAGLSRTWLSRHSALMRDEGEQLRREAFLEDVAGIAGLAVFKGSMLIGLAVGAMLLWSEQMSIAAFFASLLLMWRALSPLSSILQSMPEAMRATETAARLNDIVAEAGSAGDSYAGRPMRIKGALAVHKLSFRHEGQTGPVLLGVEFSAEPGDVIGICGADGAGKTTLIRTILGLHPPATGSIAFDGVDIQQIDQTDLRSQIGYVSPAGPSIPGSIVEAVRLHRSNATREDVCMALEAVDAMPAIAALPDGIDTMTGSARRVSLDPVLISRIELAGALLRDPRIILVDALPEHASQSGFAATLRRVIRNKRGETTIIVVTENSGILQLVDKKIEMTRGTPPRIFRRRTSPDIVDATLKKAAS